MTEGLSAADVMALTKDNDNWQNNPFIYLVWLALLGGNGFGGFGGGSAFQNAVTRSDMFEGFNNQDVNGQLRGIVNGLCDGFYSMNTGMLNGFAGVNSGITNATYGIQNAIGEVNRNIDSVKVEGFQNTCTLTNAIHAEGEATRALIQQNTMQELRDKLADKDRELMSANFQISQQAQNATLISAIRPFPQPAYITCSPYASNSTACVCG